MTKPSTYLATFGVGAALAIAAMPASACFSATTLAKLRAAGVQTTTAQQRAAGTFDSEDSIPESLRGSTMLGVWKFQFINPDGTKGDFGLDAVDVGGGETINSFSAPEHGNVCVGVWKQVGPREVKINHYAPQFGDDLVTYTGVVQIQEDVTISMDGKTFEGKAMFTGYDAEGNLLFQGSGTVQGTRLTLKSRAP